jgi:DNA-directed RNA polymerase specialized sigma24 family protein
VDEAAREEFRAYVAGRATALLGTATLLTGDRALAEDLVQTALARTFLAWGRIRRREAVDAYCRRVLVTTYATWWRRKWRGEVPAERLP